ncbi:MAG: PAS domain-containing protein [Clostridium sp.]|nr:PAS domain-containing protein [Clostridium sp.]
MSKQEKKWVLPLALNEQTLPAIEQITDGMPGGFFIYHADGDEELIYANQAMINIFGCDDSEDFNEYIGGSFRGLVHPEDLEQVEKSIHSQISKSSKGLDYVEYRVIRKDGVIRWIRDYGRFVHTNLYGDVFYVFVEDATERHLREISDAHAVQAARERLAVLKQLEHETAALRMVNEIFSSSMWAMEFNELGEMISVNWSEEFRAMLGYHDETDFPNELESWSDLLHEEDKEHVMREFYGAISDYTGKRTYSVEYRLLTRDRGWRWFQSAGKLSRREDGSPVTYVGIFVDITRQKLTDEMLETQRKLLEDALKQTQQAKRARSIFLSNMSHDLRTPMNAITGFATLAKMVIDDKKEAVNYLEQIMTSANDLQALISNLLDMSYIESGDMNINEIPCVLSDILWELEASVRAEVRARGLKLSVEYENLTHSHVICDRRQLNQALMNIVGNSMKFTSAGGKISIRLSEFQGAPKGYGFYVFTIQDTGIGMSREVLKRIFDISERERVESPGGTKGMGMAITQNIVETMGGIIRVESEEDKGTEVIISIQFRLA